ncbi:kinase-like protein [Paxillus ammoniavirescens]|nr:kinase-like protein [Paxillus ammoniavirescens]
MVKAQVLQLLLSSPLTMEFLDNLVRCVFRRPDSAPLALAVRLLYNVKTALARICFQVLLKRPDKALAATPPPADPVHATDDPLCCTHSEQDDVDVDSILARYENVEPLRFAGHTFRITRQIGQGASGFLWHAYDESHNEVAIKVLHKQKMARDVLNADPRAINACCVSNIRREFDALKKVTASGSPFLAPLLYSFSDADNVYFVMRHYATDLSEHLIQCGHLSQRGIDRTSHHAYLTKLWAAEILIGMQTLHSIGIMHRDLKIDNILITPAGHVSIADFGHSTPTHSRTWPHRRSIRTDRSGTPGYTAPEQHPAICARWYDYRADIYAYGLVLLDMMLGVCLFYSHGFNVSVETEIVALLTFFNSRGNHSGSRPKCAVSSVLVEKPSKRPRWNDIRQSPFFHDIDWNSVAQRKYDPSWTPCAARKSFHNPTSAIYSFRYRYNSEERNYIQAMIDASAREGEGLEALNIDYEIPEVLAHDPSHGTTCTRIRHHAGSRQPVCPVVARLRDHF